MALTVWGSQRLDSHGCSKWNSTIIAHAGDGNFHTFILFDPSQEEQRREAERLNKFMVYTALALEGTFLFPALNKIFLSLGSSRQLWFILCP